MLTHKQEKFVLAVVEGMTQADAYRHAYNAENMLDNTIINKASKLMSRDDIRARHDELMDKVRTTSENKSIITVQRVLKEISDLLETDITDIADIVVKDIVVKDENGDVVLDEDGKPLLEAEQHIRIKNTDEMSKAALKSISEIGYNRYGLYIKRYDKQKTIEMAARHLGMFTDKVEHSGEIKMPTILISK